MCVHVLYVHVWCHDQTEDWTRGGQEVDKRWTDLEFGVWAGDEFGQMSHGPGIHHCLGQLHEGEGGGGQSEYRFYEPHCCYIYMYTNMYKHEDHFYNKQLLMC